MKPVLLSVFLAVALSATQGKPFASLALAQSKQFTGVITDEMCPLGTHSHMKMGPTDAECTKACVMSHDSKYMLFDGTSAYFLSDQNTPEKFAAQKVRVTGTLDAKTMTIRVESIAAATTK